jgi:RNase P/RNase MRP subunit p30
LQFYDLAHQTALHGYVWKGLGFKKIATIGREVKITVPGSKEIADSICAGPSGDALNAAAKMRPRAIIISDARIDRKLLATIKDKGIILCIPFNRILESAGLRRSSSMYLTGRLAAYAIKKGIRVSFVSLAGSEEMLCSPIQMIELAKHLGIGEDYARDSISRTNEVLIS